MQALLPLVDLMQNESDQFYQFYQQAVAGAARLKTQITARQVIPYMTKIMVLDTLKYLIKIVSDYQNKFRQKLLKKGLNVNRIDELLQKQEILWARETLIKLRDQGIESQSQEQGSYQQSSLVQDQSSEQFDEDSSTQIQ